MGLYLELKSALDSANNEREIDIFLKDHIELIRVLNEHSWNCVLLSPQFKIGTEYIADYIVLSACSGYWNCVLIEIQSPKDRIFTKKKEFSLGLREAQRQVTEWKIWIDENENSFRSQLAKLAKGEIAQCIQSNHKTASSELRDPKTVVLYSYKIVIGRRSFLDEERNKMREQCYGFEIITFDRLLDYAKRCDEFEEEIKEAKRRICNKQQIDLD